MIVLNTAASAMDDPHPRTLAPGVEIDFTAEAPVVCVHRSAKMTDLALETVHPLVGLVMQARMGEARRNAREVRTLSDWATEYHCLFGKAPAPRAAPRLVVLSEVFLHTGSLVTMIFRQAVYPCAFWVATSTGSHVDHFSMDGSKTHRHREQGAVYQEGGDRITLDMQPVSSAPLTRALCTSFPKELAALIADYVPNYYDILMGHGPDCRYGFSLVRLFPAPVLTKISWDPTNRSAL